MYTIEDVKTGGDGVHLIQISIPLIICLQPSNWGEFKLLFFTLDNQQTTFSGFWIGTISSEIQNFYPQLYLHDYPPLWVNENVWFCFVFCIFWLTNLLKAGILVLFTLNHDNESFAETLPQDNDTVNFPPFCKILLSQLLWSDHYGTRLSGMGPQEGNNNDVSRWGTVFTSYFTFVIKLFYAAL